MTSTTIFLEENRKYQLSLGNNKITFINDADKGSAVDVWGQTGSY